ncbi:MAG: hypothetical protein IKQ58_07440 [Prevotella sp.]|nr:hypothetical protein [Prevotella sp.]
MSSEKPLIKLYRKRTFGDKLSDTFDFVGENFRTLLKYITYLVLPVAIVQTFCMNNFMTGYMESITAITSGGGRNFADMLQWLSSMGLYMLVQFVAIILVYAVSYTMMQLYEQRSERLKGVTFDELRPGVVQKCLRQLVLLVTSIAIFVVFVLLMALLIAASPYFILPVIIIAVVVLPLFVLVYPIYLFEDTGIVSAYAKSVRLGWKTWAGIVGVMIVLYIIFSIISGLISTPWYIMVMAKNLLATQGNTSGFVSSFGYTVIQYLLGVVSSFAGSCIMALMCIGIAYQYGHACDKVDGVGVDQDIENFETL